MREYKAMTNTELIEKLKEFPPDTPIFFMDYEWGETEVTEVKLEPEGFISLN